MMKSKYLIIFVLLYILSVFQTIYYYLILQNIIPFHYNVFGIADSWGTKHYFSLIVFIVFTFIFSLFLLISNTLHRIPDNFINLPNKDFWLSIENKDSTIEYIKNKLLEFGCVFLLFNIIIFEIIYQSDMLYLNKLLINPLYIVIILMIYTIIFCITLFKHFKIIK